jgi:outer membrane protein, multidrug efflux system
MRKILTVTAFTAVVLTGCTMAPAYKRPMAPVASSWGASAMATTGAAQGASDIGWREFYKDARLQKLIGLALENNRDMRVAALNVEKLRAQYRIQRASMVPTVNAAGDLAHSRKADDLVTPGKGNISDEYDVKLGVASWEVDLWGRVRSLKSKALETYLASEETHRSVQLSLVAEVAQQYLTRVSLAERLKIASDTLLSVSRSRDLTRRMREIGRSSELDVQSAEALVAQAEGNVASYERQLSIADDALVLLVGQPLTAEEIGSTASLSEIAVSMEIAPGLPSDLLTRRPDILAAEHTLKAANANIGAARAAFFPKISLTGSVGTASDELSGLFKNGNSTWSFAPDVTLPIFAGGANVAALDAASVDRRIGVANYEKAVQTAFREVADALASNAPLEREWRADVALVAAESKRLELADARYKAGLDSYLSVLSAQKDLYSAQQSLVAASLARLENSVTFYKVLGGGYPERKQIVAH